MNDAVNTDAVCTIILGPCCLLSAMTASAAVENQTPGREEKASIPFNKLPVQSRVRLEKEALSSALHWPGLAKQQAGGGRGEIETERALLQALVGIMPFTQAQASSIIALTESQSVSGEFWVVGTDMHSETRATGGEGGAAQSAPAPILDHSPL